VVTAHQLEHQFAPIPLPDNHPDGVPVKPDLWLRSPFLRLGEIRTVSGLLVGAFFLALLPFASSLFYSFFFILEAIPRC
jgi:hypothetical protein